jgi:hypothetical protein
MRAAVQDLEARRPVWEALSTLFLDTDVSLLRDDRARQLADSPYTPQELDRILRDEVFPVCSWNSVSIAGEWAGFDPQWLEAAILRRLARRFRLRLGFGHLVFVRSREWKRTKASVQAIRSARRAEPEPAGHGHDGGIL